MDQFQDLCRLFTAVSLKKTSGKYQLLTEYFQVNPSILIVKAWRNTGKDMYPMMRLLVPLSDKLRSTYGLKETNLAKTYIAILGLAKGSADAELLLKWKSKPIKSTGISDFAQVLYHVLQKRIFVSETVPNLTLDQVNELLDRISNNSNSSDVQKEIFSELLNTMKPEEQKWLIRIILKDLKLGVSCDTILKIYHNDALEAFNTYSDLKKVIDMFKDPNATLAAMDIQMGCPFRPMLSKRVKPHQVLSCMNKEMFYMEVKLDGERVLMHKNGDQFRWFSRNAIDYTDLYGASKLEGALTPYINDCFGKHASSLILDGEMLVYNYKTNEIQPFGDLKKACVDSKTNGQDAELRPFYVVFDCLHVNGISMANMPLSKRKAILKQVFNPKEHRIELIDTQEGHTQQDVLQFLDQMILNKNEGLIVKNPNTPYLPADRSNAWLKIKADYIDYLAEPFDVVIIGGFYGGGRRQGILASFMYGIIDDRHSDGLRILSFGKLGSGFTDEQLEQLNGSEDDWFEYQPSRKPNWFIHEDSAEKPDVLIDPDKAPIIAMACTEVVPSSQYATGCAPRFPTMKDIREDKSLKDCMTYSQLQDFMRETAGKMYTKRLHEEEYHENELMKTPVKKRKATSAPVTPARTFSLISNKSGQLFSGMSFYLVPGTVSKSCEDLITQYGGLLVGNPVKGKTSLVVADKTNLKVNNLIKSGNFDIVKTCWIMESVESGRLLEYQPRFMLSMTNATQRNVEKHMDPYGGKYHEHIDAQGLKILFSYMETPTIDPNRRISLFDDCTDLPRRLFEGVKAYVDVYEEIYESEPTKEAINDPRTHFALCELLAGGADIHTHWQPDTTHLVMRNTKRSEEATHQLLNHPNRHERRPHITTLEWVFQSQRSKRSILL